MKKKQNTITVETKKKHIYIRKPYFSLLDFGDYFKVVPSVHHPLNKLKSKLKEGK